MELEEIKEKFSGRWRLVKSENFEDFLKEVGANVIIRKLATTSSPDILFSVEGEIIRIVTKSLLITREENLKLGEPYETETRGVKSKQLTVYEDGKLKTDSEPQSPGFKPQHMEREIVNGEMVLVIKCGDVVCTRWYKKIE